MVFYAGTDPVVLMLVWICSAVLGCGICGFGLGHSLSVPVGSLWGVSGPPWLTWMWCCDDVGKCNAEALHV